MCDLSMSKVYKTNFKMKREKQNNQKEAALHPQQYISAFTLISNKVQN